MKTCWEGDLIAAPKRGGAVDYKLAIKYYKKGIKARNPYAMRRMGEMYRQGKGVPQDDEMAAKWFTQAAEEGDRPAMLYLSELYMAGTGVPKDERSAEHWRKKAASPIDSGIVQDIWQGFCHAYRENRLFDEIRDQLSNHAVAINLERG